MPADRLTVRQLAARWGISERTIRRLIESGALRAVDMSAGSSRTSLMIRESDIEAFDRRRAVGPSAPRPPRRKRLPVRGKDYFSDWV